MAGYTKLWNTLVTSTVWQEPLHVKVVWITMLALTDAGGYVAASVPGLANIAGVSVHECEEALSVFLAPDPYSRTQEHEGRRIEVAEGGWVLLNYAKHRHAEDVEARRESNRKSQADWRARQREKREDGVSVTVTKRNENNQACTQAEAEAEAEAVTAVVEHHSSAELLEVQKLSSLLESTEQLATAVGFLDRLPESKRGRTAARLSAWLQGMDAPYAVAPAVLATALSEYDGDGNAAHLWRFVDRAKSRFSENQPRGAGFSPSGTPVIT